MRKSFFVANSQLKIKTYSRSYKAFKGTFVNRTLSSLHEGLLEIALTVFKKNVLILGDKFLNSNTDA